MALRPSAPTVVLRSPVLDDEAAVAQAQKELESDPFEFVFQNPGESWPAYVDRVERERLGIDIAADRVPATFLLAEVDGVIVGSISIAHELNDYLASVGGHIGYGVHPAFRRHGYGRSILRQSLGVASGVGLSRVLITCSDDNVASIRLIESCGGVLESVITVEAMPTRRYWIELDVVAPT